MRVENHAVLGSATERGTLGDTAFFDVQQRLESGDAAAVATGLGEGALPRVIRAAYQLLGRRTFLTTGDKESRAWTFRAT